MKKKIIIIIGLCLAIVSFLFLSLCGKTYTVTADVPVSLTDVESMSYWNRPSEILTCRQAIFCKWSRKSYITAS